MTPEDPRTPNPVELEALQVAGAVFYNALQLGSPDALLSVAAMMHALLLETPGPRDDLVSTVADRMRNVAKREDPAVVDRAREAMARQMTELKGHEVVDAAERFLGDPGEDPPPVPPS